MNRFHGLTLNVGGGLDFSLSFAGNDSGIASVDRETHRGFEREAAERPADLRIYVTDARQLGQHCLWKRLTRSEDCFE